MGNPTSCCPPYKELAVGQVFQPAYIRERRSGQILWLTALLLPIVLGLFGLVIDLGILMGSQRQTQNAADAAALAGAYDLLKEKPTGTAIASATAFVNNYNGLADAAVTVHIPPASGPYAGNAKFVEAIVTVPSPVLFMRALGMGSSTNVAARAVAGREVATPRLAVGCLDPRSVLGLMVKNGCRLKSNGLVAVNSNSGLKGMDEYGNGPPINSNSGWAAQADDKAEGAGVFAPQISIGGGVVGYNPPFAAPDIRNADYSGFDNIDPSKPSPLRTKQPPTADPLINLPTPTTANGVIDTNYGSRSISSGTVTLNPGVYTFIKVSGGTVTFNPGIYVLRGGGSDTLKLSGGTITAKGVMFYNTGDNFDVNTGSPDKNDGENLPPYTDGAKMGKVSFLMTPTMEFSPIDTTKYSYTGVSPDAFNGMLVYERRRLGSALGTNDVAIGGDPAAKFSGAIYAKWDKIVLTRQGTYDSQIVGGRMEINSGGDVWVTYGGGATPVQSPGVYLVE